MVQQSDTIRESPEKPGAFAAAFGDAERPLPAYGLLLGAFASACSGFAAWLRWSGRPVPERVAGSDLLLVAVGTHKASRLVTRDRVTGVVRAPFTRHQGEGGPGEVEEQPRGSGMRLAIGELLTCPYCVGMWIAAAGTGGLIVAPRLTRWVSSALAALTIADFLQVAYRKAEDTL